MGKGDGSGEGKGGCSCCFGETDCAAPDPANVPRWVTDIIPLLGFITFWVGMVVCASLGFASGDLNRLFYFIDYNGNRCGDGDLANYKYTYWTHPMNMGTNVCVESCPAASEIKYTLTTNSSYVGSTNIGYSYATSTSADCLLTGTAGCLDSTSTAANLAGSSTASCCTFSAAPAPNGLYICVPSALAGGATSYAQDYVDSFSTIMAAAAGDLGAGWYIIALSAIIALFMSFIWTYILKYSAACFVWSVVALSNIMLLAATAISYYMYDSYKTTYDDTGLSSDQQMMYLMIICLGVFGLASLVLLCMTVCMCKQIRIAVGIIEAACEAVQDMWMIVLFPIFSYLIMLLFLVYWIIVAMYMASSGDYEKNSLGAYTLVYDETIQQAGWYHFFGLLWMMAFIRHMTILILAGAFGVWYWTSLPDKTAGKFSELHPTPIMSSLKRSFTYHVGTVALGSFIIAVLQLIQYILEYIKRRQDSKWIAYIIAIVQCIVKCFERLMEYISKCAYIVTACKGNMFCTAAWASFQFLLKHLGQHAVVNYISAFLMGLGKVFILATTVAICFVMASAESKISSPYLLLIVCALIAYVVAALFLGVFDVGIDTILVCFCWEADANGAMENAEGEKMIYGTEGLIKFIDGAKKQADDLAKGGGGGESSAPVTEVQPAAAAPATEGA